jgi:hypothetical protein
MVLLDLVIVKSCGVNKFSSSMIIVHCLLNCRALLFISDVIHLVASSALVKRLGVISPLFALAGTPITPAFVLHISIHHVLLRLI